MTGTGRVDRVELTVLSGRGWEYRPGRDLSVNRGGSLGKGTFRKSPPTNKLGGGPRSPNTETRGTRRYSNEEVVKHGRMVVVV